MPVLQIATQPSSRVGPLVNLQNTIYIDLKWWQDRNFWKLTIIFHLISLGLTYYSYGVNPLRNPFIFLSASFFQTAAIWFILILMIWCYLINVRARSL